MRGSVEVRGALAALLVLAALPAAAQTSTVPHQPSFSVERLTPPPGPAAGFQLEDADVGTAFALVTSVASEPLVIRAVRGGATLTQPVAWRAGADLLGALALGRFQLGLALPFVVAQGGDRLAGLDLNEPGAEQPLAARALGDLRLSAKAQLVVPRLGYGWGVAGDLVLTLPSGDEDHFAGEAGPVVELRVVGSYRAARAAVFANLGGRVRATPVRFFNPLVVQGNELTWGVGATLALPVLGALAPAAVAEVVGAWGGDDGPSPAEAHLGVRGQLGPRWSLGVAGGAGLGGARAIGAPGVRGVVELRFVPSPVLDADGDGIPDVLDKCPTEPEDKDGFQDEDGCPDPDNDGDGIPDVLDKCPNEPEDKDHFEDEDGCPDPDNDGDGIPDVLDKCPNQPEDKDGFQDEDGCPDPDNDGDGIPDAVDLCPNEPEDKDGFEDQDGCPDPDNDGDGVPDALDKCPAQAEDRDGWEDEDGCADLDDDRDGVPDAVDRCPDAPGFIVSPTDMREDGCPHGPPLVLALPDGSMRLGRAAVAELAGGRDVARVIVAIARAAHHAGWDDARGPDGAPAVALEVTVPGDAPGWGPLAERRSTAVVRGLIAQGVRARVVAQAHARAVVVRATPEALQAGRHVHVRGASVVPSRP
jgi:hypothetical protein